MRFLHTADWHLGRVYRGRSLLEDQAHLLDQFCLLARELRPDVVLIAGDVFDRPVPPAEAVRLLDETLTRLVIGERVPVILIAGNHDSPDRLGFGARLLDAAGLIVRGRPQADVPPVILRDIQGEVAIYALPYAEPGQAARLFPPQAVPEMFDHQTLMAAQLSCLRAQHDPSRRSVVIAHAYVQGGEVSESERPLAIGGAEQVAAELFAGWHYVALGHLHRPQSLGGGTIHYAGSLMKYSFNEVDQQKSVTLATLDGAGKLDIERIALAPKRDLRLIEGRLDELIAQAAEDARRDDYILARLLDHGAVLDAMARLRAVYPNALGVERLLPDAALATRAARDHRRVDLRSLFGDFFRDMTGVPLDEAEARALDATLAAIEVAATDT